MAKFGSPWNSHQGTKQEGRFYNENIGHSSVRCVVPYPIQRDRFWWSPTPPRACFSWGLVRKHAVKGQFPAGVVKTFLQRTVLADDPYRTALTDWHLRGRGRTTTWMMSFEGQRPGLSCGWDAPIRGR